MKSLIGPSIIVLMCGVMWSHAAHASPTPLPDATHVGEVAESSLQVGAAAAGGVVGSLALGFGTLFTAWGSSSCGLLSTGPECDWVALTAGAGFTIGAVAGSSLGTLAVGRINHSEGKALPTFIGGAVGLGLGVSGGFLVARHQRANHRPELLYLGGVAGSVLGSVVGYQLSADRERHHMNDVAVSLQPLSDQGVMGGLRFRF